MFQRCVKKMYDMHMCIQGRRERRKKFLDHDVETNDIDQAMSILLDVTSEQFKKNVELHGAVHTDELRWAL